MTAALDALLTRVSARYDPAEYPALLQQIEEPSSLSALSGLHVLDATPIFTNTLAKHAALLAAGAQLSVSVSPALPHDPEVVSALDSWGVRLTTPETAGEHDVVMDCAGVHAGVPARLGYVELTRSGVGAYIDNPAPVIIADDGRAKLIENALGTADGWIRAMEHFGHAIDADSQVVLFGNGKVGRGVVLACARRSASLVVVDPADPSAVHPDDAPSVLGALAGSTCVVTATGITSALGPYAEALVDGTAVLANLGATDEFGPAVPPARVLNGKAPVNVALDEPTLMPYIDPTMALVNAAGNEVAAGRAAPGPQPPDPGLDSAILQTARVRGRIGADIDKLFGITEDN